MEMVLLIMNAISSEHMYYIVEYCIVPQILLNVLKRTKNNAIAS